MIRRVLCLCVGLLVQACAAPPPLVKPDGPSALVIDSASGGGRSGGAFFYLADVDGQETADNSLRASHRASFGQGANMRLSSARRYVPAGPHRLRLVAQYDYAAPIQLVFQKTYDPINGDLQVELLDGHEYRVTGVFDAFRREIWLEDTHTGSVIGERVVQRISDPTALRAMADAGYACCNLRYEGDWISDANWVMLPMIPPGTRIRAGTVDGHWAKVLVEGRPMRVGLDYGREQLTTQALLDQLIVKDDPRGVIAGFAADVQAAIKAGQVAAGMTRQQVIFSLGPPRADVTPSTDAPRWTYWIHGGDEFVLVWGHDGRLERIEAEPPVRAVVEYVR